MAILIGLLGAAQTSSADTGLPAWAGTAMRALADRGATDAAGSAQAAPAAVRAAPDAGFNVPWEGVVWRSMPDVTWAACQVSSSTMQVISMAVGQWNYAAAHQGSPVHLQQVACNPSAQILITEAPASSFSGGAIDPSTLGATVVLDANGNVCDPTSGQICVAQQALTVLFTDNWQTQGLTDRQAAKTVAHEIGHGVGLGHAHYCNFNSLMAQNCEPLLPGLGADDIQSLDALVPFNRSYFGLSPVAIEPQTAATPAGTSVTYPAGWNLVAGPRATGFSGAANPIYTLLDGDPGYRVLPASTPAESGFGYWAYFRQATTVRLSGAGGPFYSAPAQPGDWFMIGNDNATTPMRVLNASQVLVYDPQSASYKASDILQPGQGAWVEAGTGGEVDVALTSLSNAQVNCYLSLGDPSTC